MHGHNLFHYYKYMDYYNVATKCQCLWDIQYVNKIGTKDYKRMQKVLEKINKGRPL